MVICSRLLTRDTRRFAKEYELIKQIGKGSFGEVWVCKARGTGQVLAAKLIDKSTLRTFAEREDVQREIAILEAFAGKHEGVVQLKEVCEGDTVLQIVMELCSGGDLFELLKERGALPEAAARALFRQLASAMAFCHAHGVVHRDVKPENILLDVPGQCLYDAAQAPAFGGAPPVTLKVADFGLAAVLGPDGETSGYTGSRYYTAPEMLKGWMYGRGADVWSLGVVLCTMLTGRLPFAGQNKLDIEGLRRAIIKGKVNFGQPSWLTVPEAAKDLVRRMLTVDPKARITADELLLHPWLAEGVPKVPQVEEAPTASPLPLPGHASQSLPASPVDTHRNAPGSPQRGYGSAGMEKMSEFRLCEPEAGAVAVAAQGGPMAPPPLEGTCARVLPAPQGAAVGNVVDVSSEVHPQAACCMGLGVLGDFTTPGVWCFPLLLGGWGMDVAQESEHRQQLTPAQPSSPRPLIAPVASTSSGRTRADVHFRLGEPLKCLAPKQEFYVR